MNKVVKVDFGKEKRDTFKAFEKAMLEQEKAQRFKTAGLMVVLSLLIIGVIALPFVFSYLKDLP